MKKLLLIVGLLFVVGCGQKNLTWTPTAEEWQLMSPTERNDWYRVEMEARQSKAATLQGLGDFGLPGLPSIYDRNRPNYWQEKRAKQEYYEPKTSGTPSQIYIPNYQVPYTPRVKTYIPNFPVPWGP